MQQETFGTILPALLLSVLFLACTDNRNETTNAAGSKSGNTTTADNDQLTQERLRRSDCLDFQFYSHQQWY